MELTTVILILIAVAVVLLLQLFLKGFSLQPCHKSLLNSSNFTYFTNGVAYAVSHITKPNVPPPARTEMQEAEYVGYQLVISVDDEKRTRRPGSPVVYYVISSQTDPSCITSPVLAFKSVNYGIDLDILRLIVKTSLGSDTLISVQYTEPDFTTIVEL